jgi:hypothetical protein
MQSQEYVLQKESREAVSVLKKVLVKLTLQIALHIWLFILMILDDFIFGLDILRAYDAAVDLKHHVLQICEEKVSLWHPGSRPQYQIGVG